MAAAEPARKRVLILGGTGEAADLAARLVDRPGFAVTSSLAGRTRAPAALPGEVRVGGFGGADGLAQYLRDGAIDLVVDATHPFAAAISRNAAAACAATGRPRLTLCRPPWTAGAGDRWIPADSIAAAAAVVGEHGRRVFLTVGRQDLAAFSGRPAIRFLVRVIDPPETPLPLADHEVVLGRGPFEAADEVDLLRRHAIDLVVSKNSGGAATYPKIVAARTLGLPVLMIARPHPPAGARVAGVEAALAWLERLSV